MAGRSDMIVSPGLVSAAYTAMLPIMLATKPVLGVARAEDALEQLDAQRLDLVDVARAREPAVDGTDMAFGRALADLRREQRAHGRADRRFGREQIDALAAAPALVARNSGDDLLLHVCW